MVHPIDSRGKTSRENPLMSDDRQNQTITQPIPPNGMSGISGENCPVLQMLVGENENAASV